MGTYPFHFAGYPAGENIVQVFERTQDFLKELIRKDDDKTYCGILSTRCRKVYNDNAK